MNPQVTCRVIALAAIAAALAGPAALAAPAAQPAGMPPALMRADLIEPDRTWPYDGDRMSAAEVGADYKFNQLIPAACRDVHDISTPYVIPEIADVFSLDRMEGARYLLVRISGPGGEPDEGGEVATVLQDYDNAKPGDTVVPGRGQCRCRAVHHPPGR